MGQVGRESKWAIAFSSKISCTMVTCFGTTNLIVATYYHTKLGQFQELSKVIYKKPIFEKISSAPAYLSFLKHQESKFSVKGWQVLQQ